MEVQLINQKLFELLDAIGTKGVCLSRLCRYANISFVYTLKVIKDMEVMNMITIEEQSNQKIPRLTEKGTQVLEYLRQANEWIRKR
jgi:predicted transcriptional regulator